MMTPPVGRQAISVPEALQGPWRLHQQPSHSSTCSTLAHESETPSEGAFRFYGAGNPETSFLQSQVAATAFSRSKNALSKVKVLHAHANPHMLCPCPAHAYAYAHAHVLHCLNSCLTMELPCSVKPNSAPYVSSATSHLSLM